MTTDLRHHQIVAALLTARDLLAESGTDAERFGFAALEDEVAFLDAVDALCEELQVQLRVRRGTSTGNADFAAVRAAFAASKPDVEAENPTCCCSTYHPGPGDHYRDGCHVLVNGPGGKDDCPCPSHSGFTAGQVRADAWAPAARTAEPDFR